MGFLYNALLERTAKILIEISTLLTFKSKLAWEPALIWKLAWEPALIWKLAWEPALIWKLAIVNPALIWKLA